MNPIISISPYSVNITRKDITWAVMPLVSMMGKQEELQVEHCRKLLGIARIVSAVAIRGLCSGMASRHYCGYLLV